MGTLILFFGLGLGAIWLLWRLAGGATSHGGAPRPGGVARAEDATREARALVEARLAPFLAALASEHQELRAVATIGLPELRRFCFSYVTSDPRFRAAFIDVAPDVEAAVLREMYRTDALERALAAIAGEPMPPRARRTGSRRQRR